jgi:hybrid polyketide synthase/nonribosomal peptide synthetase ACE1
LAAIVKAALALKHAKIPPNLLFNRLNPALEPYYRHLKIPTELVDWPKTIGKNPRRASINSFGFGGANAHAILESFDVSRYEISHVEEASHVSFVPYVLSAASEKSLKELSLSYGRYIKDTANIDMHRLAYTLLQRRSIHPYRKAFTASSKEILLEKLENAEKEQLPPPNPRKTSAPGILGVFTGQGAQWPAMGRQLLCNSQKASQIIKHLDDVLLGLHDPPSWNLATEIMADESNTRIRDAEISQPACTAIQIMLVDLLRAGGIRFKAVVGHSSGEITAAYAAGYLSAEDAIITAYYRGKHAKLAAGRHGEEGSMMAVGTTVEDAEELCELPAFKGRLCIAACNAPTSVTLSGDAQAVKHAMIVFQDEEKMAKVLFVDKAYHSHHMVRCSDAYRASLDSSPFSFREPIGDCVWISSVHNKPVGELRNHLTSEYWNDNMIQPVLFSQALKTAYANAAPFDLAIEIGPHPALKRPTIETYNMVHGSNLPYTSFLQRGKDDVTAFSEGIGQLWELLGDAHIDIAGIQSILCNQKTPDRPLGGLPTYPWTHDRQYWHESRVSQGLRNRTSPTHHLLGNLLPDGTSQVLRWRQYMSVREMPWLEGHKLQEQIVFPAAGYVSMAVEATKSLSPDRSTKLIDVEGLIIKQAMAFQDDVSEVETLFTLYDIIYHGPDHAEASFTIESTVGKNATKLNATASGRVLVEFGAGDVDLLPSGVGPKPNLISVPDDRFYDSLADVGYHYTGAFKGLSALSRKNGHAEGLIENRPPAESFEDGLMIHPATLDLAIQAIILAHSYPYDGQLFAIHVPVQIEHVRLNVGVCDAVLSQSVQLPFVASTYQRDESICGDVEMYATDRSGTAILQVEGIKCVLFSESLPGDDSQMFSTTEWATALPCGTDVCYDGRASEYEYTLALDLERTCYFYLEQWARTVPEDNRGWQTVYKGMFRFMNQTRSRVKQGQHLYARSEWSRDTEETILQLRQRHPTSLDMKIIHVVGSILPAVLRNETTILEHLMQDNLLNDYYAYALGFPTYTQYLARMVAQLTHRHPHMHILEIGRHRPLQNSDHITNVDLRRCWNWWCYQGCFQGNRLVVRGLHLYRYIFWFFRQSSGCVQVQRRQDEVLNLEYRRRSI